MTVEGGERGKGRGEGGEGRGRREDGRRGEEERGRGGREKGERIEGGRERRDKRYPREPYACPVWGGPWQTDRGTIAGRAPSRYSRRLSCSASTHQTLACIFRN